MFMVCVIILMRFDLVLVLMGVFGVFKGFFYGGVLGFVLDILFEVGSVDWVEEVFV